MEFSVFTGKLETIFSLRGVSRNIPSGVYDRAYEILAEGADAAELAFSLRHLEENLDRRDLLGSLQRARGQRHLAQPVGAASDHKCDFCHQSGVLPTVRAEGVAKGRLGYYEVLQPCLCRGGSLHHKVRQAFALGERDDEGYGSWFRRVIHRSLARREEGILHGALWSTVRRAVLDEKLGWSESAGPYWFDDQILISEACVVAVQDKFDSLMRGEAF